MNAEPFHQFLLRDAKIPSFPIVRPFNWQKLFITIASVVVISIVTKLAWPQIHQVVTNKNAWAVGCLVFWRVTIKLTIGYDLDVHFWAHV